MNNKKSLLFILLCLTFRSVGAQVPLDWHMQTPGPDSIWGASINKAYDVLKGREAKRPVTVAVISRGFDTEHEDLKDVLWTNSQGQHGWNFLGLKDGRDVMYTRDATARAFDQKRARFEELWEKGRGRTDWESAEVMNVIKEARKSSSLGAYMSYMFQKNIARGMEELNQQLHEKFPGNEDFTLEQFNTLVPSAEENRRDSINSMAFYVTSMVWSFTGGKGGWNARYEKRYDQVEQSRKAYEAAKAQEKDERGLIGDNINDLSDNGYGNENLLTGNPSVGTGLAGVIGARRGNGIGVDGIADAVRLMLIRAVPEGDEYDKDIAEAILYAVNNGADIVLVAAHKMTAENEQMTRRALDLAEQRGVLIVKPAGEGGYDEDVDPSCPTVWKQPGVRYSNIISVAASDVDGLPLAQTNYGRKTIDVFAPGVGIYSCDAGDNYFKLTGTNAAGAVVAGVAALLKSRLPGLTAAEIKDCIVSTAKVTRQEGVFRPFDPREGTNNVKAATYGELCISGGIIDAAAAAERGLEAAGDLEALRGAYERDVMNPTKTLNYLKALKGEKKRDKKEYAKVANDYVLVSVFYMLMKENPVGAETLTEELRRLDPVEIEKMKLPLNVLRQTQLDYMVAAKRNDVKGMTAKAKRMVGLSMPKDNMCDAVIYGFVLQKTVEAGTLEDARAFVAFMKEAAKNPVDERVAAQLKGAIENGEGYIMLKEYEGNDN